MRKSSMIVGVTIAAITIVGLIYIGSSYYFKNHNSLSKVQNIQNEKSSDSYESLDNQTSGEYKFDLSNNESITAKYIKSKNTVNIYSLYPVDSKEKYDISQTGNFAVYLAKDGNIWALYNDGTKKKLTPDKYESIEKSIIQKEKPDYIWAEKPVITRSGDIRFISNLPDIGSPPKKSIWEISVSDSSLKKIYTPTSDNYKFLGYRDDGKLLIWDGDNITAVDMSNNSTQNIDIKGKYILSLSSDGTKIIYVKKNSSNLPDFNGLYIMDSYGNKPVLLPGIYGFSTLDIGAWDSNSYRYAFLIKPLSVGKMKVAVIDFHEPVIKISDYAIDVEIKSIQNCKLKWSGDDFISLDTDEDIVTVQLK